MMEKNWLEIEMEWLFGFHQPRLLGDIISASWEISQGPLNEAV